MTSDAAAEPGPANPVLSLLRERRSVRAFTGEHVDQEDLRQILLATRQAPSSINAQGLSLVVVRDPERIRAVAEIAGGQPQVAGADVVVVFVIDYHRTGLAADQHGRQQVVQRSAEGVLVGAVDAGIALATFQTAAHSLGYATTAIGGIRNDPAGLIELLGLPEHTFPVVASTLGAPDPEKLPRVKPRLPLESYAMEERYDEEAVARGARAYDEALRAWWDEQGMEEMGTWSQDTSATYATYYFPTVAATMEAQGFRFLDGPQAGA
ncbi:nitroreductase family protein [Actinomyces bowdenii]|uniref:nitroreductase family protein n=1 Tax=Actinomyces bowdenii TaxID=131109 RepID=UPI001ABCBF56|nr:nitroreductase family protein [Actinomyces bowdenii]MBO3725607.1 nitroreductase family protein [Actinomyces bowdenii]